MQSDQFRYVDGKELFDHYDDPGEENNVIDKYPKEVEKMSKYFDEFWSAAYPLLYNEAEAVELKKLGTVRVD